MKAHDQGMLRTPLHKDNYKRQIYKNYMPYH